MRGLVLNLGLKSVRAIVFDESGRKLAASLHPVQTYLRGDLVEQDPEEWWQNGVTCIREALEDSGTHEVAFVTATGSAACLVVVDESGRPLRRAIMVSDRRSSRQAERLGDLSSFASVRRISPAFVPDPYFMAPKARWLLENEPDVFERARWWMSPTDFLVHRLCGAAVTDPLNAEKFFYDLGRGTYPLEFFEEANLDERRLLPVAQIGERVGTVQPEAAVATGLPTGTPILLSTYDAICAFWGSGGSADGDVADVSGTVTSVRVLSQQRVSAQERRVFTQTMPGTSWYLVGGSNNLGGGLVEWLKQSFYSYESRPYEVMESEAEASGAGARGILFLPYLLGERCPIWDPDASGVFFGLERNHQRGDFARAVLESTAFGVQHILSVLREHGISVTRLRVSGGLSRVRLTNLIKADVTGLPTEILEEHETAALGAFLIAGTGSGTFSSLEEAAELVRVREIVVPNEERGICYREVFELYIRLYEQLRDLFADRRRLLTRHRWASTGRLENL